MNKQQLAAKIWASANKMRSKIEANEYKDYILGFIFYKYLSEQEEKYFYSQGATEEDLPALTEEDAEVLGMMRNNLGYFIGCKDLFSTWLKLGHDFSVDNVLTALSAFDRLVDDSHSKVFDGIFNTLQTGISKLGNSTASQTKAVSDLIHLIDEIPMDGKQDYDVLGYIYEYLISQFASNAGKKAGEFYTPHEVSLLMSEIVADHLSHRNHIEIYDPTSGSGSLLINIGKTVAKHGVPAESIKYYAQELVQATYNLTRMNLIMRGIRVDNIETRNDDTLARDWPWFDEKDPDGTYEPLFVDAVVSNPPYSQNWDPDGKETDPRFSSYGIAPKSKADYAFLLHCLFHLKPDGVMTIILPHGVLFRGDQEGVIRRNLVEHRNIEAIIGLPANIFYGTGIPTIIMVLRKPQTGDDGSILIVDASKGFEKDGKNNKLRSSDIKRVVDVVRARKDAEKFARVVSIDEVRANDYNLNIPRYVDSSEDPETWDIYATMFGGVPTAELDKLHAYWEVLPGLRECLFNENGRTATLTVDDVTEAVASHESIREYQRRCVEALDGFDAYLYEELIDEPSTVHIASEEDRIADDVFERLSIVSLVDKYVAYQVLDDQWEGIAADLETIQSEGFGAVRQVDQNMVTKKKGDTEVEEQDKNDPWKGRVLPFGLVQECLLADELAAVNAMGDRLSQIANSYGELISELSDEDLEGASFMKDGGEEFDFKALPVALEEELGSLDAELAGLLVYRKLVDEKSPMQEQLDFIAAHSEVAWNAMKSARDGSYTKRVIAARINEVRARVSVPEGSFAETLEKALALYVEEARLKKEEKAARMELVKRTKAVIEGVTDEQALDLLHRKWVTPLVERLQQLPGEVVDGLVKRVQALCDKYATTLPNLDHQIRDTERELCDMLGDLTGNDNDMAGIHELQRLLMGDFDA
ncbi:type I restriction-modification system subunit M [Enorma massiliensis]|uniref:site-specific DNA-methyltransferase (adenine-specific) n=1 Tax=Enorma massiliensis TaxID=1472761 RepID=A0A1Y3UDJ7_9ACTN|nr:type I restriction-modification system subunit M [Enorma massiliensis]OUN43420.1 type I restriction-modification system subunit M [Enorma massiliensis]